MQIPTRNVTKNDAPLTLCSVHLFSSQHAAHCETKMKEYLSFYVYLYIIFCIYLDSPFDKFLKIAIHTLRISQIVYLYFLPLTVSVWRLVFGTPASLNLARLLETTFHIFKILLTEKLPKCRMTKMRHRQLRPQRRPKRFQRPIQ